MNTIIISKGKIKDLHKSMDWDRNMIILFD